MIKHMSTAYLDKKYIDRLKLFFKKKSVEECCKEFNIKSAAYREGLYKTVETLRHYYEVNEKYSGGLYFQGSMKSSKDILFNERLIYTWLNRYNSERILDKHPLIEIAKSRPAPFIKQEDRKISDLTVKELIWILKHEIQVI